MRKLWPTPGGVHPPEHKTQSLQLPLVELPLPTEIVLPLAQHLGAPAKPVVAVGERVLRGQLVADLPQQFSAAVHASTSGTVAAIEDRPLAHASGLPGPCIVITPDGKDEWAKLSPCAHFATLSRVELLRKIQDAGVVGMGGAGFPTAIKLDTRLEISTLIVNGTECEPYITADDILMQTQAEEIVKGIALLDLILSEPAAILIAIEDNKPAAIAAMQAAINAFGNARMEVVPLPVKYPSGGEKQLVQMLTGQEIPVGKLPAHVGAICQNVATVLAAYRAVRFGEPLTARITTVTGNAFAQQQNVLVRIGTPVAFVLQQQGFNPERATRLVMGGPMMGFTLLDSAAPVIKSTNCLLAPSLEEAPPPPPAQACIRCGMCAEACPASLLPQQLYWYARAEDEVKLKAYNLADCIECGACSYVCPSSIPLVQYYRAAKGLIKIHGHEKLLSDRARERFEFRKERIDQEKADRARAREEAATKARQRQIEKERQLEKEREQQAEAQPETALATTDPAKVNSSPSPAATADVTNTTTSLRDKIVADALARVKQSNDDDDKPRLERNLASSEDRLKKLATSLTSLEISSPDQANAVRARIKETEIKIQGIREKLARFDAVPAEPPIVASITANLQAQQQRIAEKMSTPLAEQRSQKQIELEEKLAKIHVQLAAAQAQGNTEQVAALELASKILGEKIAAEANGNETAVDAQPAEVSPAEKAARSDAIAASMERAMHGSQSHNADTLRLQIQMLQTKLQKTQERLDNNPDAKTLNALADAVSTLEHKLDESQTALNKLES